MTVAEQEAPVTEPEEVATPVEESRPKPRSSTIVDLTDGRAFIRLPNQFQHADVRLKALAAKARRMRQLRDPEADAYVILEAEMDDLVRGGDTAPLIDEIVRKDWWKDHMDAVADVKEREEFAHIEEDQERHVEMLALPEDKRDGEEFAELERHLLAYNKAVEEGREARQKPRRDALADQDITDLVSIVREDRISAEGNAVFNLNFTKFEVFTCTHCVTDDGKPTKRYFDTIEEAESADPDDLRALTEGFQELEASFNSGLMGNP